MSTEVGILKDKVHYYVTFQQRHQINCWKLFKFSK